MQNDTKTALYFVLLILSVIGLFAFMLFYPFAQEPRTLLSDDILLEYGEYDYDTGIAHIIQVHNDGALFVPGEESSISTLTAAELDALTQAIADTNYQPYRQSNFARFAQKACTVCLEQWTLIHHKDTTIRVYNLGWQDTTGQDAVTPVRLAVANI